MTTISMPNNRRNIIPIVLGITILLAVIQWKSNDLIHHGLAETEAARQCLGDNGVMEAWSQQTDCGERIHLLTQDKSGNIFDVIIRRIKDQWFREVTSFKPNPSGMGNDLSTIHEWLLRKGATRVK